MAAPAPKVLLIGWDAADWKIIDPLIERGEMPTLARFIDEGVMGDMTTLQPVLSPMLWNSIATGKRADKHGILGFTEVDPHSGNVRPVTSTSRRVKALWNILTQRGYRSNIVNWFGGHPAEPINGVAVSDAYAHAMPGRGEPWPLMGGTVHPHRCAEVLAELRVRPDEISEEIVLTFVPRAAEVDQAKDRRLDILSKLLAECLSVHAAATYLMQREPWDFTAIYYPSLDHFSHSFIWAHPPRLEGVDEKQFELYHDVLNGAYRLHDLMLRALLALAGEETTVILVSDHGFHSDHLRPRSIPQIPAGPAIQHRPLGIFCMRGPGVKRDERIYGANLLDITPTVLSRFGLPVAEDMDGRVLAEAFEQPSPIEKIPSWESVAGDAGMHTGDVVIEPSDSEALLEQFIALGYVDRPPEDREQAAAETRREQHWNLACVHLDAGRYHEALPLLEQIHEELPERPDFALALARALLAVGLLRESEATIESLVDNCRETPAGHLILAEIAYQRGRYDESVDHLLELAKTETRLPDLHVQIGNAYSKLKRWPEAEAAFRQAIGVDPHSAPAHLGLAASLLPQRRPLEAAEAALAAVSYAHPLPLGHFYLGVALARMNQPTPAAQALETALRLHAGMLPAHRLLARLYDRLGQSERAEQHRQHLMQASDIRREHRDRAAVVRREIAKRSRARRARLADRAAKQIDDTPATRTASEPATEKSPPLELLIVSGLPRSGTSLMMQMLAAGGMPIMTDGERKADPDNPEGYYEWEQIKKIRQHPEILRQAEGRAIKVITALLPALPRRHRYKIIFMDRPIEEVVASQAKMIARRATKRANAEPARMAEMLEQHRATILLSLERSRNVELLKIPFGELVEDPRRFVGRIIEFAGNPELRDVVAMTAAARPELHRNRTAPVVDAN